MDVVEEIEKSIEQLPSEDRKRLLRDLWVKYESAGDAAWARILEDPAPRPALNAVAEEIEKEIAGGSFKPLKSEDFNR
ncbi:MAG: hypothetical protein HY360_18380 [Verrucomicrobia bacterium]|nr:hypothetical protein [Verrucomicrobiota bacterium]